MKLSFHFSAAAMMFAAPAVAQQAQREMVRLETPPPPQNQAWSNFWYGAVLAVDGDCLLVTDKAAGPLGMHGGEAYFYRDTVQGWRLSQRVTFGTLSSTFGSAVALSGDRAVIGAQIYGAPGNREGRAYVYERNPNGRWVLLQELVPPGPSRFSLFGTSVAIDTDHVIVGTPHDSIGGGVGGFYVYKERPGVNGVWDLQQEVTAQTGDPSLLGAALAIGDGHLFASSPEIGDSGQVTVYEQQAGQWTATQVLEASPPLDGDQFGASISLRGDELLVGVPSNRQPNRPGMALLFERNVSGEWIERHEFRPSDGFANQNIGDNFGVAVALGDGVAFAGAPHARRPNGDMPGKAYKFVREDGIWPTFETRQLVARGFESGTLGGQLSYDGNTLVVGDSAERAVFTYREELGANECHWISADRSVLRATGSLDANDEDLTLVAGGLEQGARVIFAASATAAHVPFGDGAFCFGSPVVRLNRLPDVASGLGVVFREVPFNDPRLAGLTTGTTWTFQAWHTHSENPTKRLTNAVRLTLN